MGKPKLLQKEFIHSKNTKFTPKDLMWLIYLSMEDKNKVKHDHSRSDF